MVVRSPKRLLLLACVLSLSMFACRAPKGETVPDVLTGTVEDKATGMHLQGVNVEVFITEKSYVPYVGPEGTVKHKIAKFVRGSTDTNGLFSIDMRSFKRSVEQSFPNEEIVMDRLLFRKAGYADLYEEYVGADRTFRLQRR
jgi:hypothetical protein